MQGELQLPYSTASQSQKTAKIASIMPQTHLVVEVLTSGEVLGCPDEVLVATADPFPVAIPSVSNYRFRCEMVRARHVADLKIRLDFVFERTNSKRYDSSYQVVYIVPGIQHIPHTLSSVT